MPFPMKIQPVDAKGAARCGDPVKLGTAKSRLKRLFERQFHGVLRTSSAEKLTGAAPGEKEREDAGAVGGGDQEPSSVCLAKMVQSFMEDTGEKPPRCGRRRCNCFNGSCNDSSDDELDFYSGDAPSASGTGDAAEILKALVPCASVTERNLLADASSIVEKSKIANGKDGCKKILTDGLQALGYDASICNSRWEKTPSIPAGEYEYVDVIADGGDRLLVDVDFRSMFEIARPTKHYRSLLQSLPSIFVGRADRLQQIVAVVSESARISLKKKGLHVPPWRKPEYITAKWLSPYARSPAPSASSDAVKTEDVPDVLLQEEKEISESGVPPCPCSASIVDFSGEFEHSVGGGSEAASLSSSGAADEKAATAVVMSPWKPPAVRPKPAQPGTKVVVAGLASVLRDNT